MTRQGHLKRCKRFKTTPFFAFRSHDKESSYADSIEQRRGWLDSIVFSLQVLVLSFSSYHIYSEYITGENQWIIPRQKFMVGVNFLGMLMYAPPLRRKFGCISNYLLIFRVPLLAISHLYLSLLVRDNSHIPQMVQCSQIWAESAAIEKLVGVLVWQCLFPLFAAFPFYIAVITMTANVYITFGAIFNMCYFAFDMCPKSSVQYLLLSKIFAYADILFPTAIADAADQLDLPRCTKSLGWIQISLLGPISLYVVMMVEIRNRQMFASFKSWIHESLELDMRRQSLWKVCCELLLAVILTRQILGNWYDHLCRAKLSEQW